MISEWQSQDSYERENKQTEETGSKIINLPFILILTRIRWSAASYQSVASHAPHYC